MSERRPKVSAIQAADYVTGEVFMLMKTTGGWWMTSPVPGDFSRYYPDTYYGKRGQRRFPEFVEWLQKQLYRRRAGLITRATRHPGRILDVGCGPGHLLAIFRELGWKTLGTEATASSAAIPCERHGLEVLVGELRALGLEPQSFDAVVSWHSLEHMPDPEKVLDEIERVLKSGGVLWVSVPDFSSLEAQASPEAWFHLDVPRHLCHFPAAVLRAELEKRGLVIEQEIHGALEYDAFSLVQTWQNRLGLPANLFYRMLKAAHSSMGAPSSPRQRAVAWILGVVLLPIAFVITCWRAFRKRGAVVTILARKPEVAVKMIN